MSHEDPQLSEFLILQKIDFSHIVFFNITKISLQ